jgi:hypothetical protein
MGQHFANLPNLVISSGGTASTAVVDFLSDAKSISIAAPTQLTGTVTVQVSHDGTTWVDLTSGGSDVLIGASNMQPVTDWMYAGLRVTSNTAEASTRTFTVLKSFEVR